jgi:hypothetical protein
LHTSSQTRFEQYQYICYSPIDEEGNKFWYNSKGQFHREDGPAKILVIGYKEWCQNGKIHREDGPAIIYPSGLQIWVIEGERIK